MNLLAHDTLYSILLFSIYSVPNPLFCRTIERDKVNCPPLSASITPTVGDGYSEYTNTAGESYHTVHAKNYCLSRYYPIHCQYEAIWVQRLYFTLNHGIVSGHSVEPDGLMTTTEALFWRKH